MVTEEATRGSFWHNDDLFLSFIDRLQTRFESRLDLVGDFLKPHSITALISSYASVLADHTPRKIREKRWEKLLRVDTAVKARIREIHLQEMSELKCKKVLLQETAALLMETFGRCLNGTYGAEVQEAIECLSPAICSSEGLIRLLAVDAIFQRVTLSHMAIFSSVNRGTLCKMRRSLREFEERDAGELILDERAAGDRLATRLNQVVKQASKRLSDLDLSKSCRHQEKKKLIDELVLKHLSPEEISKITIKWPRGTLDREIEKIGRCPEEVDLVTPCHTALMGIYEMMIGESEKTLALKAEVLLFVRGAKEALEWAETLDNVKSKDYFLLNLAAASVRRVNSDEILRGILAQVAGRELEFIRRLGWRLGAVEKAVLFDVINTVVEKRHLKLEMRQALGVRQKWIFKKD